MSHVLTYILTEFFTDMYRLYCERLGQVMPSDSPQFLPTPPKRSMRRGGGVREIYGRGSACPRCQFNPRQPTQCVKCGCGDIGDVVERGDVGVGGGDARSHQRAQVDCRWNGRWE